MEFTANSSPRSITYPSAVHIADEVWYHIDEEVLVPPSDARLHADPEKLKRSAHLREVTAGTHLPLLRPVRQDVPPRCTGLRARLLPKQWRRGRLNPRKGLMCESGITPCETAQ